MTTQTTLESATTRTDELAGKVAVISGGSRGIGRAIADRLVAAGAKVVISARNQESLDSAVQALNEGGEQAVGVQGDMATAEATAALFQKAAEWGGGVDILVNNVGGAPAGKFLELTDEQLQGAWSLKLLAAIRLARLAIPSMTSRGGGAIINIIGLGGREPKPGMVAVATTNAAIRAFTKALSSELAPQGITINAISPARVRTERAVELSKQTAASRGVAVEVVEAEALKAIPTGRLIEPKEVAEVAFLLASGRVPSLTGAEIVVDGGTSNYM